MFKTRERFELIDIDCCDICSKKQKKGFAEGVTEEWGLGTYHSTKHFCEECFFKNTYTNDFGFTFLKYKGHLFCYKPFHYLDFGFRQVVSDRDINRAFNPDRFNFENWLNKEQ